MDVKRKKLVFHFYTFPNFKENEAIQIHLKCLKRYHTVFTEAVFVIAIDNINDHSLIRETQNAILDCGFETVNFIVKQNTHFREALTFYDEVVAKMEANSDYYIFFGHTKGVTNFQRHPQSHESLRQWIHALYFLSLNFTAEAEHYLCSFDAPFFGSLVYLIQDAPIAEGEKLYSRLLLLNNMEDNYQGFYSGTFFFINPAAIIARKIKFGIEYQLPLTGLSFAESYPTMVSTWQRGYALASHLSKGTFEFDFYNRMTEIIPHLLSKEEYDDFITFVNSNE